MTQSQEDRFLHKAYDQSEGRGTRELYADWASVYDTEVGEENGYAQPARCAAALGAMLEDKTAPILDVGCGSGLSGLALRKAGYETIDGCDFSEEMLDLAHGKKAYRRLFWADLNAPPLDCAEGAYGAATAVGVFSFGHVSPDALDEILRVLRPGAPLIIGLNDHFYEEGSLEAKIGTLEAAGRIRVTRREHGDHLPGIGVKGWVISILKA